MGDWCERLKQKIGEVMSQMTTLSDARDGVAFEETIGGLFQWLDTLEVGQRFAGMAREGIVPNTAMQGQFQQALRYAANNGDQFVEQLHESLFDEFGPERVDSQKAVEAYGSLFRAITNAAESSAPASLVCATTNYDRSLEMALAELAPEVRTGFTPQLFRSSMLEPRGLGEFVLNRPALMYLHGAVGWYRTEQGFITSMPADQGYNPTLGRPAVLYPGPDKDIARAETVELWRELEAAIREASHILVIGHALNDQHLVDAVRKAPGKVPSLTTFMGRSRIRRGHDTKTRSIASSSTSREHSSSGWTLGPSYTSTPRLSPTGIASVP
jgi:hypothetical protein